MPLSQETSIGHPEKHEKSLVERLCGKSPTSLRLERLQNLLAGLRAVYGPSADGSTPLYAAYGQTLSKDQAGILNRWAEHFNSVLNHVSNHEATDQLPQRSIHEELEDVPTEAETIKALKQLF